MLELDTPRNRQLGIAMVSVTTLCFAALDSSAKWLVMALPVFQVVWLRFVTHSLLGILMLTPKYGWALYRTGQPRLQLLRALMQAVMTALNFWALQYLQLDVTGAIQFSVPILIAVISAKLLGERLDARRWIAILVGFAGVLLIVRPGSQGFHPAIFLSLLNAVLYALFNMLTRRLAMGAFGGLGHLMVTQAHRYASAAVLGPFLYQQIIYMTLFGWLIFGHVPDAAVMGGASIVVASGLYLLYREFRR